MSGRGRRDRERRLARLEALHRRRDSMTTPRYDSSALSPEEQYDLALLLGRVEAGTPDAEWVPGERDRLETLMSRVRVEGAP